MQQFGEYIHSTVHMLVFTVPTINVMRINGKPVFCTSDLDWSSEVHVFVCCVESVQVVNGVGEERFLVCDGSGVGD